jgi:hypothetical protein
MRQGLDAVPPAALDDLGATLADGLIVLEWSAITADIHGNEESMSHYVVLRTHLSDIPPTDYDSIGFSVGTVFTDSLSGAGVAGTDYGYGVKAVDAAGNKSPASATVGEFDHLLHRE